MNARFRIGNTYKVERVFGYSDFKQPALRYLGFSSEAGGTYIFSTRYLNKKPREVKIPRAWVSNNKVDIRSEWR